MSIVLFFVKKKWKRKRNYNLSKTCHTFISAIEEDRTKNLQHHVQSNDKKKFQHIIVSYTNQTKTNENIIIKIFIFNMETSFRITHSSFHNQNPFKKPNTNTTTNQPHTNPNPQNPLKPITSYFSQTQFLQFQQQHSSFFTLLLTHFQQSL